MMNTDKLELQDEIMPMIEGVYSSTRYACETILIVVVLLFVMY